MLLPLLCALTARAPSAQTTNAQALTDAAEAVRAGRTATVLPLLEGLGDLDFRDRSRLVALVCETMPLALAVVDRPLILEAIRLALRKLPAGRATEGDVCNLRIVEAQTLDALGRHTEALALLDSGIPRAAEPVRKALARMRGSLALVGAKAPPVAFGKALGGFSGLDAWRGKVVVLDFFAHWCKPCAAAFPELKALYAQEHPRGLELLGVTGYYGYYGPRKGLTNAEESDAMEGFRREKALPWPVAFVPPSVDEAYRIMALPSTVVIDRRGTVRAVGFGYSPAESADLRAKVGKLLSER